MEKTLIADVAGQKLYVHSDDPRHLYDEEGILINRKRRRAIARIQRQIIKQKRKQQQNTES